MTPALVLNAVLTYGPSVVPLIQTLGKAIADGRGNVPLTDKDWAELSRLAEQSSADIYKRLGITPPPQS